MNIRQKEVKKEESEEYIEFQQMVEALSDYLHIKSTDEKFIVDLFVNLVHKESKSKLSKIFIPKERLEHIKAMCYRWTTKRRKAINAEKNAT